MYTLFNDEIRIRHTNVRAFDLDYVKREMTGTLLERYLQYRAVNPGYLKNNHILQRILGIIDVEFTGDLMDYYVRVSNIVNRISGQMGFCNASHHGKVFKDSAFYGKGISEVIITVIDDTITPKDIWYNWKSLSAIRVLSHPLMGCGIIELDGETEYKGVKKGSIATLEINIPLLACQYQLWRLATRYTSLSGSEPPTAHFLTQVVIPNILSSHLDVAILNSFHAVLGSDDYLLAKSAMPFYVTDLWPRLEKGLTDIAERFIRQGSFYKDVLTNIPTFSGGTLLETVKMPDVAHTNQAIWALTIARLPAIAMLLKLDSMNDNTKNDAQRLRIRRSLIEAESGKYLTNQIPSDVASNLAIYLENNIHPYL